MRLLAFLKLSGGGAEGLQQKLSEHPVWPGAVVKGDCREGKGKLGAVEGDGREGEGKGEGGGEAKAERQAWGEEGLGGSPSWQESRVSSYPDMRQ